MDKSSSKLFLKETAAAGNSSSSSSKRRRTKLPDEIEPKQLPQDSNMRPESMSVKQKIDMWNADAVPGVPVVRPDRSLDYEPRPAQSAAELAANITPTLPIGSGASHRSGEASVGGGAKRVPTPTPAIILAKTQQEYIEVLRNRQYNNCLFYTEAARHSDRGVLAAQPEVVEPADPAPPGVDGYF